MAVDEVEKELIITDPNRLAEAMQLLEQGELSLNDRLSLATGTTAPLVLVALRSGNLLMCLYLLEQGADIHLAEEDRDSDTEQRSRLSSGGSSGSTGSSGISLASYALMMCSSVVLSEIYSKLDSYKGTEGYKSARRELEVVGKFRRSRDTSQGEINRLGTSSKRNAVSLVRAYSQLASDWQEFAEHVKDTPQDFDYACTMVAKVTSAAIKLHREYSSAFKQSGGAEATRGLVKVLNWLKHTESSAASHAGEDVTFLKQITSRKVAQPQRSSSWSFGKVFSRAVNYMVADPDMIVGDSTQREALLQKKNS